MADNLKQMQNFAALGVNLSRGKYGPLDVSSVFYSLDTFKWYLKYSTKAPEGDGSARPAEVGADFTPRPYEGQIIAVSNNNVIDIYVLGPELESVNSENLWFNYTKLAAGQNVDAELAKKADWFGGTAPVDKNGEIVTIGAAGSITASGIKIVNSAVNNSTTEVPTSKAVQTYVAERVASAVQYLGIVSGLTDLSTTAGQGDFYRLSAAVAGGHAGDLVIAVKDNPAQLIDGTNWSLIHGEEVGVEAINPSDGIEVITTGESSEAQPTIAIKPATTATIGGIIVGTNLTVDTNGKLSAIDTTYEDVTTTTHGLMTAADKIKLNGIAEGANKTIVDAELTETGTNPVQGKAIYTKFDALETSVSGKVDKVDGKGLSSNDYTTDEKNKLASLKNYILPIASVSELGGVLVHSAENPGGDVSTPKSTTNRDYGIKIDQDGNLWVTVPWTDTKYSLPVASEGALGGIKVGYSGTTAKTYAVKLDANNKAYVEVPWQNTTYTSGNGLTLTGTTFSLNVASSAMHGGIKLYNDKLNKEITPQAASDTNGRYYRIQLDNANRAFVNVPWTDTTYTLPTAKQDELGGIKLKYVPMTGTATINAETTTAGRFYAINVDKDGYAFVNVPWTDNNTFRTIQVDTAQTDAMAPLNLKSGTNIALALEHGSESENVTINHTGPGAAAQNSTSATASDGGTVAFGGEFYVPKFAIDANGHTRDLGRIKYKLPTPETYSLQIATTTTLGGIKSGNEANNFVAGSGGEGHTGNVPNYEAEVVVNSSTGKATVNLEAMAGPETQWSIVADQTVFGIRQVSTDKLVQGTNTLIINGGGAAW